MQGSWRTHGALWIAMEYCGGGSVADLVAAADGPLEQPIIAYLCAETLSGLKYLHSIGKVLAELADWRCRPNAVTQRSSVGLRNCAAMLLHFCILGRSFPSAEAPLHTVSMKGRCIGVHLAHLGMYGRFARCAGAPGHQVREHPADGGRAGQAGGLRGGRAADAHDVQAQHLHRDAPLDGPGGHPGIPLRWQGKQSSSGTWQACGRFLLDS